MEHSLKENECHPSTDSALVWLKTFIIENPEHWIKLKEAIFSSSLAGNRTAEIVGSTINRLESKQLVSDRYLLGLVWFVRDVWESNDVKKAGNRHK